MRHFFICDFSVKIHIVRENENLLDIVALNLLVAVFCIVIADTNQLSENGADEEKRTTKSFYHTLNQNNTVSRSSSKFLLIIL